MLASEFIKNFQALEALGLSPETKQKLHWALEAEVHENFKAEPVALVNVVDRALQLGHSLALVNRYSVEIGRYVSERLKPDGKLPACENGETIMVNVYKPSPELDKILGKAIDFVYELQ